MSSRWTHIICGECYFEKEGGRFPHKVGGAPLELCCYCSKGTDEGIFYRDDPANAKCQSSH